MITLKYRDFNTDIDYQDVLEIDSKENLLDALKSLGIKGCSRLDKLQLASKMVLTVYGEMVLILSKLSDDELDIVKRLVDMGPNSYVEMPILPDTFYDIQRYYLVFSYEDKENGKYLMMMPDEVRMECEVCLEEFWEENYRPLTNRGDFVHFLPAFTPSPGLKLSKMHPQTWLMITDSVMRWVTMMDYCFYYNVYTVKTDDRVLMACCLGDLINSIYDYDALRQEVIAPLPVKSIESCPHIYDLMKKRNSSSSTGEVYLDAFGFNNQPREWFVIKDMGSLEEWEAIANKDPFHNIRYRDASRDIYEAMTDIAKDIYSAGDVLIISALNEYMKINFRKTVLRF